MNHYVARYLLITSILFGYSATTWSAEWKSLDGMVSVTLPDPTRFQSSRLPPNYLAHWQATHEKLMMFVVATPIPEGIDNQTELLKGLMEFALLEELKETLNDVALLSSHSEQQGSFDSFLITAKGSDEEGTHYFTEKVIFVNSKIYTATVRTINEDSRTHPVLSEFLTSFKITEAGLSTTPPLEREERPKSVFNQYPIPFILFFVFINVLAMLIKAAKKKSRTNPAQTTDDE